MPRPCSRPEESIAPRWSQKAIQCAIGKGFVSSANSTFCVGNLLQLHQEQKKRNFPLMPTLLGVVSSMTPAESRKCSWISAKC